MSVHQVACAAKTPRVSAGGAGGEGSTGPRLQSRLSGEIGSLGRRDALPTPVKWQPTPVFLPGKSHGQRSLAGCSQGVSESQLQLDTHGVSFLPVFNVWSQVLQFSVHMALISLVKFTARQLVLLDAILNGILPQFPFWTVHGWCE